MDVIPGDAHHRLLRDQTVEEQPASSARRGRVGVANTQALASSGGATQPVRHRQLQGLPDRGRVATMLACLFDPLLHLLDQGTHQCCGSPVFQQTR